VAAPYNACARPMSGRRRFAGKRPKHKGPFFAQPIDMLKSPAFRTLSLSGHRAFSCLVIELAKHAGNDNGNLVVTFDDFETYGIHRHSIAPAIRELVALGFVEITEHGCAGNAYERAASKYRLTMTAVGTTDPTHEWKKINNLEEARRKAAEARAEKNKIQWRKPPSAPVQKTATGNPKSPVAKSAPPAGFPSVENRHYYLESTGGSTHGDDAPATPPAPPASPGRSARGGPSAPAGPAAPTAGQQQAASERAVWSAVASERRPDAPAAGQDQAGSEPCRRPHNSAAAGRATKHVSQMTKLELDAAHAARRARYANGAPHVNGSAADRE
jgi:hypothetical protein